MKTIDEILRDLTDEQIEALLFEAGSAGDEGMVGTCRTALHDGTEWARRLCAEAIANALYQQDDVDEDDDGDDAATRGLPDPRSGNWDCF